ncbi:hypothetical protein ACWGR4_14595 [Embleya sp. NPDC055664]
MFTRENGESYHPADLTDEFRVQVESAGLAPIRFHDLRHDAAAIHLGSGGNMKEVQVETAEQFISRANEKTAGHTSGTP